VKLLEFQQEEIATGYYDPAADKIERRELDDTRKPVLKLRDLNRLKKMRALQQLERLKREDLLAIMYAAPEDGGGMGGMGGPGF
jgi:predicted RNA-binding protein with PUA-like domain